MPINQEKGDVMRLTGSILAVAVTLAVGCSSHAANAQGAFTLTSPDFKDGERLAVKNAGNNKTNPNCRQPSPGPTRRLAPRASR
jgi:hypothetical protein